MFSLIIQYQGRRTTKTITATTTWAHDREIQQASECDVNGSQITFIKAMRPSAIQISRFKNASATRTVRCNTSGSRYVIRNTLNKLYFVSFIAFGQVFLWVVFSVHFFSTNKTYKITRRRRGVYKILWFDVNSSVSEITNFFTKKKSKKFVLFNFVSATTTNALDISTIQKRNDNNNCRCGVIPPPSQVPPLTTTNLQFCRGKKQKKNIKNF